MELSGNALRANIVRPTSGAKLRRPETDFARQRYVYVFVLVMCVMVLYWSCPGVWWVCMGGSCGSLQYNSFAADEAF